MKILHILGSGELSQDPERNAASGIVRVVLEVASRQAVLGHDVTIASIKYEKWQSRWRNVNLQGLPSSRWAKLTINHRKFDFSYHVPLVFFTHQSSFDVIHAHNYAYFRLLKGKHKFLHFHADPFYPGRDPNDTLNLKPADFRLISRSADAVIAVSHFVAGQFFRGLPEYKNIYTIHNGVNLEQFGSQQSTAEGDTLRNELRLKEGDLIMLFAGAITPEKGVIHLVNAFIKLADTYPNLHLVIVGSSGLWQSIENDYYKPSEYEFKIIDILQPHVNTGRVHFLGKVKSQDMPFIYSASDFVVIPSICKEAFCLVALECLASGKPVIASNIGGIPELVNFENGLLVEPGQIEDLKAAIGKLSLNPGLREELGKNGRKTAEQFTWDRTVSDIEEIYRLIQEEFNR